MMSYGPPKPRSDRPCQATFSTWCLEASAAEAETPKKKRKKEKSERELGRWPTPNLTFVEQASFHGWFWVGQIVHICNSWTWEMKLQAPSLLQEY